MKIREKDIKPWKGQHCSLCEEPPVAYWPAYEPEMSPKPYCKKHLEEIKKVTPLKGPRYLKLGGWIE